MKASQWLLSLLASIPLAVVAQSAAPATDPIAGYAACAAQALSRIDDYVDELWVSRAARLPRLLDAQSEGLRCADDSYSAARTALTGEPLRRRALSRHYAKLKSLITLRMPERATESRRQYAARIAHEDAKLARLWREVVVQETVSAAPADDP